MSRVKDQWTARVKDAEGRLVRKQLPRYGHGKRWLAEWAGPSGRPVTKAFDRKTDAERHGLMMEADQLHGTYVDPRRGQVSLREYAERKWLPSQFHLRPNSADTYTSHLRNHIYPAFGGRRIGSLARTDIKAFVTVTAAKVAPSTTQTVFAVLRALMASAVDDGVIAANPCSRVPLPQAGHRVIEPMPATAVLALADAITPRYRVAVVLAAGCGLREGEAFGLTVPRTDFLRRKLHIREQVQRGRLAPLKTKASMRAIPADDWVLNGITAHLARYGQGPDGVIVTNRLGSMAQRNSFGYCWREAVTAARLPEGTRFHDLRHFYASTLIAANVNPKAIQARLGHATMAETMDTYGHLFPDSEDLGRGIVDGALADALAEQERSSGAR